MVHIIFTNQQLDESAGFVKIPYAYGSAEPLPQNNPAEIYNMLRDCAKTIAANAAYADTEKELLDNVAFCIHPFKHAYYSDDLPQLKNALILHVKIPKTTETECEFSCRHSFIRTKYGRVLSIMPDAYMWDDYSEVVAFKWHVPAAGWSSYRCAKENLAAKEYEIFKSNLTTWSVNYSESFHDPPQCEIMHLGRATGTYLFMETPTHGPSDQIPIFRVKDFVTDRWRPGTPSEEKALLDGSEMPSILVPASLDELRSMVGSTLSTVMREYEERDISYITADDLTSWGFPQA